MPDSQPTRARRSSAEPEEVRAALQAEVERLRRDNTELQKRTEAVAEANAHAAELMAELEDARELLEARNRELQTRTEAVAEANAHAAELMVKLEDARELLEARNRELQTRTEAVAEANAHAAELMVKLEDARELLEAQNRELEQHNAFIRQTFGRYLTNDVVKSLLESPEGLTLGGERRKITLVMTDLRGFTSMSGRLAPEQVVTMLNRYLGAMIEVIQNFQGTIDEFIGDAIFILFGAPMQREDDAERAVACALAMQLAMDEVNARNRADGFPEVEMGIGIHTGEVVVGNIGSDIRAKYGVVGSAVNLTARIESYTVGGQVLISEATRQELGPLAQVGERLEVEAKGIEQPFTIHDIRGMGGEYDLWLSEIAANLIHLPQSMPLLYTVLDGKRMSEEMHPGHMVKLSAKHAEVYATHPLEPWSDIRMKLTSLNGEELSGDLYAKVMSPLAGEVLGFSVHFTSIPPAIEAYFYHLITSRAPHEMP
jgi:class 3 adenylate cyclase